MYDTTKPSGEIIQGILKKSGFADDYPASTDGIGTKGIYHWQKRSFRNAVLDVLAMNLNDMAVKRAKARKLHNHIMVPYEDEKAISEIVETLAEEGKKRNIEIASGETAIHDNLNGLEISVSVSGEFIDKKENRFQTRDYLIGIKSNGLHSNGFTKIREIFKDEYRKEFVEPTFIYYDKILDLMDKYEINSMCHITGEAYAKLKKSLENSDIFIDNKHNLKPQNIFYELYNKGASDKEMYKTFNCGIGFILSVNKNLEKIISDLKKSGFEADIIGKVTEGENNVKINSMFSDKQIIL